MSLSNYEQEVLGIFWRWRSFESPSPEPMYGYWVGDEWYRAARRDNYAPEGTPVVFEPAEYGDQMHQKAVKVTREFLPSIGFSEVDEVHNEVLSASCFGYPWERDVLELAIGHIDMFTAGLIENFRREFNDELEDE